MFSLPNSIKQMVSYLRGGVTSSDGDEETDINRTIALSTNAKTVLQGDLKRGNKNDLQENDVEKQREYTTGSPSQWTYENAAMAICQTKDEDSLSEESFENISLTDVDYALTNISNSLGNVRYSLSEVVNEENTTIRELQDIGIDLGKANEAETTFIDNSSVSEYSVSLNNEQDRDNLASPFQMEGLLTNGDFLPKNPEGNGPDDAETLSISDFILNSELNSKEQIAGFQFGHTNAAFVMEMDADNSRKTSAESDQIEIKPIIAAITKSRLEDTVQSEKPEPGHSDLSGIPEMKTATERSLSKNVASNATTARSRWQKLANATKADAPEGSNRSILWTKPVVATRLIQSYERAKKRREAQRASWFQVMTVVHRRRLGNRLRSFIDTNTSKSFHFSEWKYHTQSHSCRAEDQAAKGRYQKQWWEKKPNTAREKIRQYKFFGMIIFFS